MNIKFEMFKKNNEMIKKSCVAKLEATDKTFIMYLTKKDFSLLGLLKLWYNHLRFII